MQVDHPGSSDGRRVEQLSNLRDLTALPQQLLELILVKKTSIQDKKALRQTCKLFQQLLDISVTCIKLQIGKAEQNHLVKLMQRMQQWRYLRAAVLRGKHNLTTWFDHLPEKLTTLTLSNMHIKHIDLQQLARLRHLSTLNIVSSASITGLQYIVGLTSLYTTTSVGHLSHLAPTLKQLRTSYFSIVKDIDHLTNLEVLEIEEGVPSGCFIARGNLPLKHLAISAGSLLESKHFKMWELAPTTLTRLTLRNVYSNFPSALPASITHLQLLFPQGAVLWQVAKGLPGLRSLHISCGFVDDFKHATRHLSKLTNLQSLGICTYLRPDVVGDLSPQQIRLKMPEVAEAADRGVKLTVYASLDDLLGVFYSMLALRSTWDTQP